MPAYTGTRSRKSRSRSSSRPARSRTRPEDALHDELAFEANDVLVTDEGFAWEPNMAEKSPLLQKALERKKPLNMNFWDALMMSLAQCGDPSCGQTSSGQDEIVEAVPSFIPSFITQKSLESGPKKKVTVHEESIQPITLSARHRSVSEDSTCDHLPAAALDVGSMSGQALTGFNDGYFEGQAEPLEPLGEELMQGEAGEPNGCSEGSQGPEAPQCSSAPVPDEGRAPAPGASPQCAPSGRVPDEGRAPAALQGFDPVPLEQRALASDHYEAVAGSHVIRC